MRSRIAFLRSLRPQALYTSTSKRAIESAEEISLELQLEAEASRDLCEIDFGAFEGLTYQEIETRYPREYEQWMEHPTELKFPGGESFQEIERRALAFLAFLFRTHPGQTVLIVSHGGVNRVFLANALRLTGENLFRIDQSYAAVNVIDYHRDFAWVRLVNG